MIGLQNKHIKDITHECSYSIFKFINPESNDNFSKMKSTDLLELITLIDEYYLELRSELGFKHNVTFGMEIEVENAQSKKIKEKINKYFSNWKTVYDASLKNGIEINSPILSDKNENWKNLDNVCSILIPLSSIGKNSGGHIHIGSNILGDNKDNWLNLIKVWAVYENIIFRFSFGEHLTARPWINEYAMPISQYLWNKYQELKKVALSADYIIDSCGRCNHYSALNFGNVNVYNIDKFSNGNTIEIRCPNGSLNSVIWQNNVNFFIKLLNYCKSEQYNDDLVEKRYTLNSSEFMDLKWYDEIYVDQALELCDMIFTNNLDKIYFLKQYLKSFKIYETNMDYDEIKTLTKQTKKIKYFK